MFGNFYKKKHVHPPGTINSVYLIIFFSLDTTPGACDLHTKKHGFFRCVGPCGVHCLRKEVLQQSKVKAFRVQRAEELSRLLLEVGIVVSDYMLQTRSLFFLCTRRNHCMRIHACIQVHTYIHTYVGFIGYIRFTAGSIRYTTSSVTPETPTGYIR